MSTASWARICSLSSFTGSGVPSFSTSWLKYGMRLKSKLSQLIHSGPTSCAALRMPRWKEARRRLPARPSIRKSLWFIVRLLRTLPGGKWRVFGFVLPPDLQHPLQVLRCGRRWRGGEVGSRYPRLLEETLKPRRNDEQQCPGRCRCHVPPGVQRPLGDVEDRPLARREGALAV